MMQAIFKAEKPRRPSESRLTINLVRFNEVQFHAHLQIYGSRMFYCYFHASPTEFRRVGKHAWLTKHDSFIKRAKTR